MLRNALCLGALLLAAAPASAQYMVGGFGYRISAHGPHFRFSVYSSSYYYSAPAFGYGYGWMPAYGAGYGPGFGNPFFLPPPPIVAGPVFVVPVGNTVQNDAQVVKGDFHVIAPKKKDEGFVAPKFDHVVIPEKPPMPRFDPFRKDVPLGLSETELDVNERVKRARAALAAGEYGSAVEHLDRVLKARPGDAVTLFLKSQAQFAAGQYADAVATIRLGIKADANWPAIDVKPQELFGRAARFEELFDDLKRRRDANPDSVALEFLVAHQLWFVGDRMTAKASFTRLSATLRDADATAPFLK